MSRKFESSPARRERAAVGGAEGDGAGGADLAVDLVAHDDLDPEALALVEDALGGGEAGAGRLDADHGGRAAEQLARHVAGRRDALVGDGGHGRAGGQPAATEHVVGGGELLGQGQIQVGHRVQRTCSLGMRPAAVAVDVELHLRPERMSEGAARADVELDGAPADLHLEGADAELVAQPLGLGHHLRVGTEADHVAHAHPVGPATQQLRDGQTRGCGRERPRSPCRRRLSLPGCRRCGPSWRGPPRARGPSGR